MTKTERTNALIEQFTGCPGEFYMLKGILCASHRIPSDELNTKEVFDTMMIARRMDQLQEAALSA